MIGDGGGKILRSELLEVFEVKRANECAMAFSALAKLQNTRPLNMFFQMLLPQSHSRHN